MRAQSVILLLSIALLASFAGAFAYRQVYLQAPAGGRAPVSENELLGQRRPDFNLGSSTGEQVTAELFDGKVTLVNFWATWCKPCREEMPMLLEFHEQYGLQGFQVVGVALDDVKKARDFAAELGVNYPILVGSVDVMEMTQRYGNASGALPYSVLIDRNGTVRWTHLGALKAGDLTREISTWLWPEP